MSQQMTIGTLSRATGVKVSAIRFYEQIGLLPTADRTHSNRRVYGASELLRLRFIRHARELGFDVEAVRQLIQLAQDRDRSCAEIDEMTKAHLAQIDSRISRLQSLRIELQRMLDQCSHNIVAECRVIEILGDHDQCMHDSH